MEIVRVKLTADDVNPPGTRYNPDCDCVQTTVDGGTTWTENPGADPRTNDAYRLPPRTGSDPKCDAAEAMTQHFKAQVDQFLAASDAVAFVNAIIQIAGVFFGLIGLFASKIFLIFEALLTIGAIAIDAAMTDDVYDQIKCILYCHLDADGQMTTAGLAAAQSDIDDQIGGTPNIVFDLFAGLWGAVEWSNAGAVGEYTGECDDCSCTFCYEWSTPEFFAVTDPNKPWYTIYIGYGSNPASVIDATAYVGNNVNFEHVEAVITWNGLDGPSVWNIYWFGEGGGVDSPGSWNLLTGGALVSGNNNVSWDGLQAANGIVIQGAAQNTINGSSFTLVYAKMTGTGNWNSADIQAPYAC